MIPIRIRSVVTIVLVCLTLPCFYVEGAPQERLLISSTRQPYAIESFSDKAEDPTSQTFISVSQDLTVHYTLDRNNQIGYQYAGFLIHLKGADISGYNAIKIVAKIDEGKLNSVQLESMDRVREDKSITPYGSLEGTFQTLMIPIGDYHRLSDDQLKNMRCLAFVFQEDTGKMQFREVSLINTEVKAMSSDFSSDFKKEHKYTFSKGTGAWTYYPEPRLAKEIKAFNQSAEIPIRYLFAYGGSVVRQVYFDDRNINFYHEALQGGHVKLYAMVDGLDRDIRKNSLEQMERMATEIAERYNQDHRVAGVHVDVEPFSPASIPFYTALKKQLNKPLSIAVGTWNQDILSICDLPVLMGYDLGKTPKEFALRANGAYRGFANSCDKADAFYLIGLPFTATHYEWSHRVRLEDQHRDESGYVMEDFLSEAFDIVKTIKSSPRFVGVSIWALQDRPTGHNEPYQWYPYVISDAQWEMLKEFR